MERVISAYNKPGHPIAFSTPSRVAQYFGLKVKKAKEILEHVEGYNLHREYKKPKHYNPYYVHNRREIFQGDLIDIAALKEENEGVTFLLLLIDIFTKRVWVYPLKSKNARDMHAAMSEWIHSLRTVPNKLQTDQGNEFTNNRVQTLLANNNIEWQPCYGTLKASIAERANKTIQILIYKYMTELETNKYIDVLPELIATYNKRGHRTLEGMSPKDADKVENESHVQQIFHQKYYEAGKLRKTLRNLPFKVGDVVRIKTDPKKLTNSTRAYAIQFQGEYFRIVRINRTLPIAMYHLRSMDTQDYIEGGFYANELQRHRGDSWRIEEVLARRRRGGRDQLLVKWRYFGPQWNSWINADQVHRRYR